jgi:hypothetical protein
MRRLRSPGLAPPACWDPPQKHSMALSSDGGNGPVVLAVLGTRSRASKSCCTGKVSAQGCGKFPARSQTRNHIHELRFAKAMRPVGERIAASMHSLDRASSGATYGPRTPDRVRGRHPLAVPLAGRPCLESTLRSARTDALKPAIHPRTSRSGNEQNREAYPQISSARLGPGHEECRSNKNKKMGYLQ